MSMASRIKDKRIQYGYTQEELASKLGLQKSAIAKYENGRVTNIKRSTIAKLAELFECDPSWLMDLDDNIPDYPNISSIEVQRIPMLGEIACGRPIFMNQEWEVYINQGKRIDCDFCLICRGDSMINARIYDGDLVFIKQNAEVVDGDIYAVSIDDEATLKRVYLDRDAGIVQLVAENPKYRTMIYSMTDFENVNILGKAVSFLARVE